MCWNIQISFTSWIMTVVVGIYLLIRNYPNDVIMGTLILFYGTMQFWETLMWWDQKCGKLNEIATIGAYYALWSHVFAIGLGIFISMKLVTPMVVGLLILMLGLFMMPKKWKCSKPSKGELHINWGFNPGFYIAVFVISMFLCYVYIRPFSTAIIISLIFILSWLISAVYARGRVGSFWCWVAAVMSIVFVFANKK